MNFKSIVSVAVFTAVYGLGGLLPPAQARDEPEGKEEIQQEQTQPPAPPAEVIPYACYDDTGNVVFTTINPQETIGWDLGCREVQYETNDPTSPPIAYFQCFDVNGGVAFNTIDASVAKESELFCREIGARVTTPVPYRPVYYECYNTDGSLAFTTSYPQNTYGWKPGCRELQYQDAAVAQQSETPRVTFECYDTSGNVAFTTSNREDVNRWKLGCRETR
jgi:hypothetical protein